MWHFVTCCKKRSLQKKIILCLCHFLFSNTTQASRSRLLLSIIIVRFTWVPNNGWVSLTNFQLNFELIGTICIAKSMSLSILKTTLNLISKLEYQVFNYDIFPSHVTLYYQVFRDFIIFSIFYSHLKAIFLISLREMHDQNQMDEYNNSYL